MCLTHFRASGIGLEGVWVFGFRVLKPDYQKTLNPKPYTLNSKP